MKLIIESGATKADWLWTENCEAVVRTATPGMNFSVMSHEELAGVVDIAARFFDAASSGQDRVVVESVHFYAAGLVLDGHSLVLPCRSAASSEIMDSLPEKIAFVHGVFGNMFPEASVEYASDMLAAARALFGRKAGIAAILGTGSNSCMYDGRDIVKNIRPGGFILGDEGSAAVLGRRMVSDYLRGLMPGTLAQELENTYDMSYASIVRNVYGGESPSRYLGGFAPFIVRNAGNCEYAAELLKSNFRDFVRRVLVQYDTEKYCVGLAGGFAAACRDVVEEVAAEENIRISKVVSSPGESLISFH